MACLGHMLCARLEKQLEFDNQHEAWGVFRENNDAKACDIIAAQSRWLDELMTQFLKLNVLKIPNK